MRKFVLFTSLIIALLILFSLFFREFLANFIYLIKNEEAEKVLDIIDGDTFRTEKLEKIRLIGIDAPEKDEKCYEEAKTKLKELIEGKVVKLEKDKKNRDKYNRLLRYVFINKTLVNLILLKEGYVYLYLDNLNKKYLKEFIEAEKYAKENKIGCLWKD